MGWISQDLLNMVLFIPLGAGGYLVSGKSAKKSIAIGFAISCCVEVTQYFTKLGYFETDDIINNTIGTAIGAGFCFLLIKIIYISKKTNNYEDDYDSGSQHTSASGY